MSAPSLSESAEISHFECCEEPKKTKFPHIVHSKACCNQTGPCCGDLDRRISRLDLDGLNAGTLAIRFSKWRQKVLAKN